MGALIIRLGCAALMGFMLGGVAAANVWAAGKADLTWDDVGNASGYRVYEKPVACADTSEPWLRESGDIAAITYARTGLIEGKTYCWYVTAFNPLGESAPSNQVAKTILFTVPDAPANFREIK
jgi:hypothetical protein